MIVHTAVTFTLGGNVIVCDAYTPGCLLLSIFGEMLYCLGVRARTIGCWTYADLDKPDRVTANGLLFLFSFNHFFRGLMTVLTKRFR